MSALSRPAADRGPFDRVEAQVIADVLNCSADDVPVMVTREALAGSDAELLAFHRGVVTTILDRASRPEDVSQDALRIYYVEMYAHVVAASSLTDFRRSVPPTVIDLVLQGLHLMGAQEHLDALTAELTAPQDPDAGDGDAQDTFATHFAHAEQQRPLTAHAAAHLRGLDTLQVLSSRSFDTAVDIAVGTEGEGIPEDVLPRWRGPER